MEKKIAIVTGANKGLGKEIARGLAKENYIVVMACRNFEAAKAACDELRLDTKNQEIHVIELDLSSFASIKKFTVQFEQRFPVLDLLVNNAGITSDKKAKTVDGFGLVIGTNYFGPAYLTELCLPMLMKSRSARIINTTSSIYPYGRFRLEKLNKYTWVKAYAVSKYMNLLATYYLAERLRESRITVNAADPGIVRTSIMFTGKWHDRIINLMLKPLYVSPAEGAETALFLALSEKVAGVTCECFVRSAIKKIPAKYKKTEIISAAEHYTEEVFQLKTTEL